METPNAKIILIVFILLVFAAILYWARQESVGVLTLGQPQPMVKAFLDVKEGFQVPDGILEEVIGSNVTYPSGKNPFMNVLVDEIKYNPKRAPAASVLNPSVSVKLDDFFHTEFVNDPTDVFGKTQSQRQFYTMPSTTVPNDQGSYQDWLYKIPGKTCKEGGREACSASSGSAGGVYPHLTEN